MCSPLPGNPVTGTAAAWVSHPQLFALSCCQLPSMPCTNYWLWINLVLSLARTGPRLIFLAGHTCMHRHTHTHTYSSKDKRVFMWFLLKSRHRACSPPAAQRHNRPAVRSSEPVYSAACLLIFFTCFVSCSNELCSFRILSFTCVSC